MRLKSFQAKSMSEAMRQIRDTLGDDAIIVSTREEPSGWVRITAAVEQVQHPPAAPEPFSIGEKTVAAKKPPMPPEEELQFARGMDDEDILEAITDTLLRHRVPGAVSDKILTAAALRTNGDPRQALIYGLEKTFAFDADAKKKKDASRPLILVGPPGAGKTLMTAKLAARAVMNDKMPTVITSDLARAGGVEQLSAFLNILGVPLLQADDPATLKSILADADADAETIIDTGGLNPFDPQEMKHLAKMMMVAEMESALLLPAGIDAEESAEIALTFDVLGVRRLMPTRLDFARRLGGILSAADRAKLSFGSASHTPQVANGVLDLTAAHLSDLLMPARASKTTDKNKRGRA